MVSHEPADTHILPPANVSTTDPKTAAPASATTAISGRLNWDAPDLIRTYQDANDNLCT